VDQTDAGDAWFNITRLRRDFGRNSIAGVTFTNRDQTNNHNRVLAGDFRYVWGLYYTQFQYGRSWTSSNGSTAGAAIWQAEYDRTGRSWGFNYLLTGQGEGFDAQAGFVNRLRSGVVTGHAFNRFTLYGAPRALLENLTVFFGPERIWLYDKFGFTPGLEGREQLDATFQLRGGWELNGHAERNFVNFQDSSFTGYTIGSAAGPAYLPQDDFSGFTGQFKVTTPTWRKLGADLTYGWGHSAIFEEGTTGKGWQLTGNLSLRPTTTIRVTGSATVFRLDRLDGTEFARSTIPRLKLEYQPNRALFFRAIAEYRSERRATLIDPVSGDSLYVAGVSQPTTEFNGFRLDLLASFEPTPGTVAFLGYGSSMESDAEFNWSRLHRMNDGFFLKLAYQLRR
jgi:hypothetical protein